MKAKIGFLGNGNMGYAILKGLLDQDILRPEETAVFDVVPAMRDRAGKLGCKVVETQEELVAGSEIVLLAVKPQVAGKLMEKIGSHMADKLLVSIVAGTDVATIKAHLSQPTARILRVMPNTPAMVSEGVFGMDVNTDALPEEKKTMEGYFSALGIVEWIDEGLFPVITALSGGGPAFVAMFIEAMADGAVKYGLKRDAAYRIAAQTVLGSAALMKKQELHPGVLKDMVCSPGGTTIEGVLALEDGNFRATVMHSVEEATLKALHL